ncbi:hypothetical protein, partial [Vibrio cholerae]
MIFKIIQVLVIRGSGAVLLLAFNYMIANNYDLTSSGRFFWYFSAMIILSQIMSFGLNDYGLKIAATSVRSEEIVNYGLSIILASSLLMLPIAFFYYSFEHDNIIIFFFLSYVFITASNYLSYVIQGEGYSKLSVYFLNVGPYLYTVIFGLVFKFNDILSISFVFCVFIIVNFISIIIIARNRKIHRVKLIKIKSTIWWLKDNLLILLPYWLVSFFSAWVNWSGILLSKLFIDSGDISILSICIRVSLVLNFLIIGCNVVLSPQIARLYNVDIKLLQNIIKVSLKYLYVVVLPLSLVILLFSNEILKLINIDYHGYGYILNILLVGQIINALTGPSGYFLTMTGNEWVMVKVYSITSFVFLISLTILGTYMGLQGIAFAIAMSMIFHNVMVA